jgi:hypothetical protein
MAVYKVIQDVESEDKLLGPLSLKGFVYAAIAGLCAFINFRLFLIGTPLKWLFILMFALPMVLFGVLASPLGREQPTEVWLLSRIRFFLKPRTRIWDQEGMSDLVTVTAPKKKELHLTKDLSQTEVQSRLKTLASTLDTRGWAVKNVDVNLSAPEEHPNITTPDSDRLIKPGGVPHEMSVVDVHAADDILDEKNNPTAQKFESMMQQAEADRKQGIVEKLKDLAGDEPEPKKSHSRSTKHLASTKAALSKLKKAHKTELDKMKEKEDEELQKKLAAARSKFADEHKSSTHPKHKLLASNQTAAPAPEKTTEKPAAPTVTAAAQTVNMELAQSGNDISVASIAKLANRSPQVEQTGPNEVTISLH